MKNHIDETNPFIPCINNITLKKWSRSKSLVIDLDSDNEITFEELCLGLGDVKDDISQRLGDFENVDVRLH